MSIRNTIVLCFIALFCISYVQAQLLGISISGSANVNNPTCLGGCPWPQICVARLSSDRQSLYPACKNPFTERNTGCTDVPIIVRASGCDINSFCHFGICVQCGNACGLPAQLLSTLFSAGVATGKVNTTVTATNAVTWGRLQVNSANVVNFDGSAGTLSLASSNTLQFGGNTTGSDDVNAVAVVSVNANVNINFPAIVANTRAALAVATGATLRASRFIVNRLTTIALDARGTCTARFDNIQLSATVVINGPGLIIFPESHNNCTKQQPAGNNDKINMTMSGYVEFEGNSGNVDIVISRTETDSGEGRVTTSKTFATRGNVYGNGNVNITGTVRYENDNAAVATTVDADTTVLNGGIVEVKNAGAQVMGNVTLLYGSTIKFYNGARTFIRRLRSCPIGATVIVDISASGTVQANSRGVIFTYDANTYVQASGFKCQIQLIDSTGRVYNVRNPNNNSTSTQSSRQLLAESTTDPQATWTESGLVYTYGVQGAANSVQVTISLIVALMLASVLAMFN